MSDIDDAPIVTADENKELSLLNEGKKEKLKLSKENLLEKQKIIRLLAPQVEQGACFRYINRACSNSITIWLDYLKMKQVSDRAASLAQKTTDARTSLMLLRQRHPQPRLTIPLAEKKLSDQVTEMQTLNDEVQAIKQQTKAEKDRVKSLALEVENIRTEATEAQKAVNMLHLEEDDSRLLPLYDWLVSCQLSSHRTDYLYSLG